MHGVEILAQRRLGGVDGFEQRARPDQALAQAVNAVGEHVVGARHVDELLQLALQRQVAFTQDLDLPLHQADGGGRVAQVRKTQFREQRPVAFEKIRIRRKVVRNARVVETFRFDTARLAGCHR